MDVKVTDAAVVRPGDTLVIVLDDGWTAPRESLEAAKETVLRQLPEGAKVLLVAGASVHVIRGSA